MFSGLRADIATRWPHYASDFSDALHRKVASSTLYLFFACLANAIAFGALSGFLTHGQIGTIEMLAATAIGGVLYALFSAQPITLLGGTGPIVIFTALLYQACQLVGVDFIVAYAWTGLWAGAILIVLAVANASEWMRYFSRFTDDIFAALVSIIFIVEALDKLWDAAAAPGIGAAARAAIAGLAAGTAAIALLLARAGRLPRWRDTVLGKLSDFGPAIAIAAMAAMAFALPGAAIEGPALPGSWEATTSGRPWAVDLSGAPGWAVALAAIPAAFAAVLLYLDQNITSRIINQSGAGLRKGCGYHLDLLLIGAMTAAFSLFGMPWIVAATVHSVNHLRSLGGVRPGPNGPELHVVENRASALAIHLGIAASIFLLDWVALIPMPVLLGLFVYMGYVSLRGNDFALRAAEVARAAVARRLPAGPEGASGAAVRRYTLLQAGAFAALWIVKSSALGILFPLFIALCVPFRVLIARLFEPRDLAALDDYDPSRPL